MTLARHLAPYSVARRSPFPQTGLRLTSHGDHFFGHVIRPWHRTLRRRTFNDALNRVSTMLAADIFEAANSYFGLLRQASHSHADRARLANVLRQRGHAVNHALTKTYRRKAA